MTVFQLVSPITGLQTQVFVTKFQAMKSLTHACNSLPSAIEVKKRFKFFESCGWLVVKSEVSETKTFT
jgi:hypothetical protein